MTRRLSRARRALAHLSNEQLKNHARKNGARFALEGYTVIYKDPIFGDEKEGVIIHTWKRAVWIRTRGGEKQWMEKEYVVGIIC